MQERRQLHRQRGPALSLAAAAANNALWCDAVFRARGAETFLLADLWFSPAPAPAFYPNLATLSPHARIEQVGALTVGDAARGWAVKDSFSALDLSPFGFRVLFEAEWLQRKPGGTRHRDCERLDSAAGLIEWEAAWNGGPEAEPFAPALLADRRHAFLGLRQQGRIAAGCVASVAAGVVGITNLFGPAPLLEHCLAAAAALAPDLPLVTYDRGAEAVALQARGFRTIGPLRVWLGQPGPSK